jgi:hypothetical protein
MLKKEIAHLVHNSNKLLFTQTVGLKKNPQKIVEIAVKATFLNKALFPNSR